MDSSDVMGPNNGIILQTVSAHYNNRAGVAIKHYNNRAGVAIKHYNNRAGVAIKHYNNRAGVAIKHYYWSGSGSEASHRGTCRIGVVLPLSGRSCVH